MNTPDMSQSKIDETLDLSASLNARLLGISERIGYALNRIRGMADEGVDKAGMPTEQSDGSLFELFRRIGIGHDIATELEAQLHDLERFI